MKPYTDDEIMAMVENAKYSDCERLASETADDMADVKDLANELYDFVLGDNESELAFEVFKKDCLEKQLERDLYKAGY